MTLDESTDSERSHEFLAALAHELRNHLAPARHAVEVMRTAANDSPHIARAGETAARQLDQMTRLVDDLLDVTRIRQNRLRLSLARMDLGTCIDHAVEISTPALVASGQNLELSLPADPVVFDGDRARLAQVIANLLTNAAKYSTRNRTVTVAAARTEDAVSITVQDQGIGIPAESLESIFDLFVQGDHSVTQAQGGLGVGLALARQIVELHGGSVRAFSEGLGKGSRFVVTLPVSTTQS